MSLINQMLKDLEHRSRPIMNPINMLSGIQNSPISKWKYIKENHVIFIMGIFLILLISFGIIKMVHGHNKTFSYTLKAPTFFSENENKKIILDPFVDLHASASAVTGLTLQIQKENTLLRVLLSQDTLYRISKNSKQDYVIVLNHSRLLTNLPSINTSNSAIDNIQMMNGGNDLYIILTPKKGAELTRLELNNEGKYPELQIDLINKESDPNPMISEKTSFPMETSGTLTKSLISMGPEEEYQEALQYSSEGNPKKAESILSSLVVKYPEYTSARESLVKLLLEQGKQLQANNLVQIGLQQRPFYPAYAELKARILVNEGKVTDAIDLLQHAAPTIHSNPDYHAFIAALYQRQGQYLLAAKLYEQLLPLEPDNAVWWMGLGIAYENMGKHNEALQAYARAETTEKLNPELKAYVESRVHSLQ
jgi:hypothetical protein